VGKLIFIFVAILTTSISFSEIYKCKVKGNISYQAMPCPKSSNSHEIIIKKSKSDKRPASVKDCDSQCDLNENVCRSKLPNGNFNSDGGLIVCQSALNACIANCSGSKEANKLTEIANNIETRYNENQMHKAKVAQENVSHLEKMELQAKIQKENMIQQEKNRKIQEESLKVQKESLEVQEDNRSLQLRILREKRKNSR
jgi:hypothetical protein